MIEGEDACRRSPAAWEVVRLPVVAALASGTVRTYRPAAEVCGVSARSVGSWWRAYRGGGREALAGRRTRRPGRHELISEEERGTLVQAMADYSPAELGIAGSLWTRAAVRELIRLVTGVVLTERGVGRWLRRHGVTPPRPARRAYQQQEKNVQAWPAEQDPVSVARGKAEKAVLAWADQGGLRSDTAPPGRCWAPSGRCRSLTAMPQDHANRWGTGL